MKAETRFLQPLEVNKMRLLLGDSLRNPNDYMPEFAPGIAAFEKFAIGKFFWFVVDFNRWIHLEAGGNIEELSPFKKAEFVGHSHSRLHEITYPDDVNKIFAFSEAWIKLHKTHGHEFIKKLRMSLYFRMQNKHHEYYWVMVQYPHSIFDANGKVTHGLIFVTDISHLKQDGIPMMNILDTSTQQCQQFYCTEENALSESKISCSLLSKREKEILQLIVKGYSSKEIAAQLFLSIRTIDNHRQNMLHKTQSRSSAELTLFAVKTGIV